MLQHMQHPLIQNPASYVASLPKHRLRCWAFDDPTEAHLAGCRVRGTLCTLFFFLGKVLFQKSFKTDAFYKVIFGSYFFDLYQNYWTYIETSPILMMCCSSLLWRAPFFLGGGGRKDIVWIYQSYLYTVQEAWVWCTLWCYSHHFAV